MRVIDLFCGLKGFSQPFIDRGHEVISIDINPQVNPTIVADVLKIQYPSLSLSGHFDVVLASPPCENFSFAKQMNGPIPADKQRDALGLITRTFMLIACIRPRWWVVENPRGHLRRFVGKPKEMIYLCTYGSDMKKDTDLWGVWPGVLYKSCRHDTHNQVCNSSTGVMSPYDKKPLERAKMPYALGLTLCKRIEGAQEGSQ